MDTLQIITLLATLGVFGGLYYLGHNMGQLKSEIGHIFRRLDELPCREHSKEIEKSKIDISEIQIFLKTKYPSSERIIGRKQSPMGLNEHGEKLLNDIAGMEYLNSRKDDFIMRIGSKSPTAALDVEQYAYMVMMEQTNDISFKPIKDVIYLHQPVDIIDENGNNKKYTYTLQDACFALSIPLRDMYLELHPELNVE